MSENTREAFLIKKVKAERLFLNPKSKTYLKSGSSLKAAGLPPNSGILKKSDVVARSARFRESLLKSAERNLKGYLKMNTSEPMAQYGVILTDKEGKPIMRRNAALEAIKQDTTKFIAKTVGKAHYSEKVELGLGSGGLPPITINILAPVLHAAAEAPPEPLNASPRRQVVEDEYTSIPSPLESPCNVNENETKDTNHTKSE